MGAGWVQGTVSSSSGSPLAIAFGSNNTAHNLLVAFVTALGHGGGNEPTLADSQGNTWQAVDVARGTNNNTSDPWARLWYAMDCKAGANTVTLTGSQGFMGMAIAEYSGMALTNALDGSHHGTSDDGGVSGTPAVGISDSPPAGDLLVAVSGDHNGVGPGISSWKTGWSDESGALASANANQDVIGNDNLIGAGSPPAQFNYVHSCFWVVAYAAFTPAVTAAAPMPTVFMGRATLGPLSRRYWLQARPLGDAHNQEVAQPPPQTPPLMPYQLGPLSQHFKFQQKVQSSAVGPQSLTQALTGGLSFVGTLIKATASRSNTAAAVSFVGALVKQTAKVSGLTAVLSFVGTFVKLTSKVSNLTATLSFTGALLRAITKGLAGATLSFTGALVKGTSKGLAAATLSFTGAFASIKLLLKALTGALSFSGGPVAIALVGVKGAFATAAAATISPTFGQATTAGNLLVAWVTNGGGSNAITESGPSGWSEGPNSFGVDGMSIWFKPNCDANETAPTFSATGAFQMRAQLAEFSGVLASNPIDQSNTNTSTSSPLTVTASGVDVAGGELQVTLIQLTTGIATSVTTTDSYGANATALNLGNDDAQSSNTSHARFSYAVTTGNGNADTNTATTTSVARWRLALASFKAASGGGGFTKLTSYHLSASLSFVGALLRAIGRGLAATLSFAGAQTRFVTKTAFTAALSFSGAVSRRTSKGVAATLSFTGALVSSRLFVKALTAGLSFAGTISRRTGKAVSAVLSFIATIVLPNRITTPLASGWVASIQPRPTPWLTGSTDVLYVRIKDGETGTTPPRLVGATIAGVLWQSLSTSVTLGGVFTMLDATQGVFSYTKVLADVASLVPGRYQLIFKITLISGELVEISPHPVDVVAGI